ncbi:glycosyltransferase family 2 protein [Clostridium perfringens]|uniref:glycosyltransferase family 2 protein n=1 Tax=Clostridium perfringens TaxID=1502 RepID=UPI001CC8F92B|nr:glycosyltransferase family 2 protein [Clostridium perfringens]UBK75589.1 glycosyltransferase family 2 protein [Clostridium perfringens]
MNKLTVFTPTYNRAYTLHKCYESLKKQTCKNFEWLIIDDGSDDNTKELVEKWIDEKEFPIKYYYKENGGMHSGYNKAYEIIKTELAVCIDSDDYMTNNSVELILNFWEKNKDEKFAGIVGLNINKGGKIIGKPLPNMKSMKIYDYYNRYNGSGDKKIVYRTEIIKKFISPEFKGEKLFPTCYKYFNVDLEYNMLIIHEPLGVVEYMPDGFTKNIIKQYKKNLNSFIFYRKFIMNYKNATLKHKFNSAIHYNAECWLNKERDWIEKSPKKLLTIMAIPFSLLLYVYILLRG